MHLRAIALVSLLVVAGLAGCAGRADESVPAIGDLPPTHVGNGNGTSGARFEVIGLEILHADASGGALHEDDGSALVRFRVREPADAPRAETAFVTFILNGRIVDVQQVKLEPGEEKAFERTVGDVREMRAISAEVRAGASVAKTTAEVSAWPRAGADTLELGPLRIRIDHGLAEEGGRALVNLTLSNVGPENGLRDLRAKMLCALPNGTLRTTTSVHLEAPPVGTVTGVDAYLDDCNDQLRYGIEIKARDAQAEYVGRILLVPQGWTPRPSSVN